MALHHFCLHLLSADRPGAAAGAAAAEFREAINSFGATFYHFCLLLLSASHMKLLWVLPVLNSEKLVFEAGSSILDPGSRILDPGSWNQDPVDPGSRIKDP